MPAKAPAYVPSVLSIVALLKMHHALDLHAHARYWAVYAVVRLTGAMTTSPAVRICVCHPADVVGLAAGRGRHDMQLGQIRVCLVEKDHISIQILKLMEP